MSWPLNFVRSDPICRSSTFPVIRTTKLATTATWIRAMNCSKSLSLPKTSRAKSAMFFARGDMRSAQNNRRYRFYLGGAAILFSLGGAAVPQAQVVNTKAPDQPNAKIEGTAVWYDAPP